MGYNKSLSAVYSDIWERYKRHCEREGMIALNRFCEGEGIKVRRLYEWLRRRKICISDYQDSLSGMPAGVRNHEEALFQEVRRLYEWLRRRKICISDYQDSLSGMPAGVRNHEEALFQEVRLPRPSHARGDAEAATADVVRDIRIELGVGTVMSLGEIGVGGLAMLMEVLTRRGDVGA